MKSRQVLEVNGEKLPTNFSTDIIVRMMKEPDLREFFKMYQDARFRGRGAQPPTTEQRKIAEFVQSNGVSNRTAAAKFKKTSEEVAYAVKRVAIYDFLHPSK